MGEMTGAPRDRMDEVVMTTPKTLYDKVFDAHVVEPETAERPAVLYVDLHLIHEVTSPQPSPNWRREG